MLAAASAWSCVEMTAEIKAVDNVTITLSYSGDEFTEVRPSVDKVVKLQSALREYSGTTDSRGVVTFTGVIPDSYNVSCTGKLNDEEREYLADPPADGISVITNGSIGGLQIFADTAAEMDMMVAVESNIIISKIFYNGSKDNNDKNYQLDMYVEFYNNSDEEITTENLYFALLETDANSRVLEEKEEFVYGKNVFRFPVVTVAPGGSLVFAREARDHTTQAANSVDLTDADFQAAAANGSPGPYAVTMPTVYHTIESLNYLLFLFAGGNGVILFKTSDDPADFPKVQFGSNATTTIGLQIPVNSIIDGFDTLVPGNPVNTAKKRLSNKIDATYIALPTSGNYQGISFDRKVIGITDTGRKVLKDTNNSVEDFVPLRYNATTRDYDKAELYVDNPELLQ